ncbi:MAG: ATP-binding cassette domain-containing protein [Betaproteobacteria bacterium]|nr:ATP-binding cassette domain-containing protein [Betaproteobacteria bacterium]
MKRPGVLAITVGFAAAAAGAWLGNSYYVFVIATLALTALVGVGLNVLVGLAGQVSFGHVGFYAMGAYAVAILTTSGKWSFWAALPAAGVIAAATGALLALPAVRVRGPYLAMVTIAFGFIVENAASEWKGLTGGQNGIMGIAQPFAERWIALFAIALAAVATVAFALLRDNRLGKAMLAVKDSETAAESIGIDPVRVKTVAFALSAGCAGIAGGVFAPLAGFVTPSTFAFSQSILFVLAVMIGGAGTVAGPLVGAAVVVLLPEALASLAEYRLLLFGVLLLGVLLAAPEGVVGTLDRLLGRRKPRCLEGTPAALGASSGLELEAERLGIVFGGVRAASGVSFRAPPGRITSLIGPNGAGKSTVLNLLGGFYRPQEGTVRLDRTSIGGLAAWRIARAGVARTYQTTQLFDSMSVAENVSLASPRGESERYLGFVGYRGELDAGAGSLAHVDKRLVEIARALAMQPSVLLLDEPAAGLSAADKRRLAALLKEIAAAGVAVVLVEHDMAMVMDISDSIVVLDAGVVVAYGPPQEIRTSPAVRNAYLGDGASRLAASRQDAAPGARLLETSGLRAAYGAEPVLQGVNCDVREREFVAVLGANGAGKSTLMRALAGLHRPVQGTIAFAGETLSALAAHEIVRRGIVLVPEGRQVFPELSVRENLELGAFACGGEAPAIESMLERFPRLRERLAQRAGLLSGGEQQMLAVARGLMGRPKLLMLDEPSLGLAPKVIQDLFATLDRLRSDAATILLVDQMAELALSLAERAYVLQAGQIVSQGSPAEVAAGAGIEQAYLGARA